MRGRGQEPARCFLEHIANVHDQLSLVAAALKSILPRVAGVLSPGPSAAGSRVNKLISSWGAALSTG